MEMAEKVGAAHLEEGCMDTTQDLPVSEGALQGRWRETIHWELQSWNKGEWAQTVKRVDLDGMLGRNSSL